VNEAELAASLREHAARSSVPGAAIGILRDGECATAVAGVADVETGEPVALDTRFAVGSLCKTFVATAIARLVEAGRLSLGDPVSSRVPELRQAEWAVRASVGDLLANRARVPLRAELEFPQSSGDGDDALARHIANVADAKPAAPYWSYSNLGWSVVGRVIETVAGQTWEQAMRDELFDPFDLDETTFVPAEGVPCASGHDVAGDVAVRSVPWTPRALGPAGSRLLSTVTDLLRFAAAHLQTRALSTLRRSSEEIRIHGWFDAWCLGLARFDWERGRVWGWDGLISGQRCVLRLMPEQRGAVVLLSNGSTGRALYRSLLPDVLAAWFGVRMPTLALRPSDAGVGDLSRYEGVYAWADRRWDVTARATSLALSTDGCTLDALPIDDRTFLVDPSNADAPTVTFAAFDEDGRPGVLYDMLWGLPRCA
jgi:CubicO group peptidase (beta-lactamase class C family)